MYTAFQQSHTSELCKGVELVIQVLRKDCCKDYGCWPGSSCPSSPSQSQGSWFLGLQGLWKSIAPGLGSAVDERDKNNSSCIFYQKNCEERDGCKIAVSSLPSAELYWFKWGDRNFAPIPLFRAPPPIHIASATHESHSCNSQLSQDQKRPPEKRNATPTSQPSTDGLLDPFWGCYNSGSYNFNNPNYSLHRFCLFNCYTEIGIFIELPMYFDLSWQNAEPEKPSLWTESR